MIVCCRRFERLIIGLPVTEYNQTVRTGIVLIGHPVCPAQAI